MPLPLKILRKQCAILKNLGPCPSIKTWVRTADPSHHRLPWRTTSRSHLCLWYEGTGDANICTHLLRIHLHWEVWGGSMETDLHQCPLWQGHSCAGLSMGSLWGIHGNSAFHINFIVMETVLSQTSLAPDAPWTSRERPASIHLIITMCTLLFPRCTGLRSPAERRLLNKTECFIR